MEHTSRLADLDTVPRPLANNAGNTAGGLQSLWRHNGGMVPKYISDAVIAGHNWLDTDNKNIHPHSLAYVFINDKE